MKNFLTRKRIEWVDFAKGFVIILVVIGHVIPFGSKLREFIFIFHMPFFFVMAGYLLNTAKWGGENFFKFIFKSARRLLRPYFVANFAWYPIWFIFCYCLGVLALYDWANREPVNVFLSTFIGNSYKLGFSLILTPLWFLPCLFLAEIFFLKLHDLFANKISLFYVIILLLSAVGYVIGTRVLQIPLGLDVAFVSLIFLLAGNLIKKYNCLDKFNLSVWLMLLIILLFVFHFNHAISMNQRNYANIFLFYAGGIAGSLIVMKISMLLADFQNKIFDFIKYCGQQSVIIMVMHMVVLDVAYHITTLIAAFGFRNLPLKFMIPVIISGVIVPVWLAKKFADKPIIKYFCA